MGEVYASDLGEASAVVGTGRGEIATVVVAVASLRLSVLVVVAAVDGG